MNHIRQTEKRWPFVIGRDLGPAGRVLRILAGLLFLVAAAATPGPLGTGPDAPLTAAGEHA